MKRHFSNWLREYAVHTEFSEAPVEFHFWAGVSTIAGALRRQVWIDQRHFQWTPNMYIILVGPPGVVTKSTAMRTGMKMLREVPGVCMGPQSMTWQGLTLALEEAVQLVPYTPVNAPTPEPLMLPMACITCDVAELGTFLRTEDPRMVDVLTDLWDGQLAKWEHKLRTQQGAQLQNPWINILGCTTPTWIRKNVPEDMVGGGLVSRILFVYGDKKRNLVPYPADVVEDTVYRDREAKLIDDLKAIGSLIGEYHLTREAKDWGIDWYRNHWSSRPEHLASERYEGYLGRKQTHMHKLAIVLAAAERNELIISKENLETANAMLGSIESHMLRVFESIGMVEESRMMRALVEFVRVYKSIEKRDLWRLCMRNMSLREFAEATDAAINAGEIRLTEYPGGIKYTYTGAQ